MAKEETVNVTLTLPLSLVEFLDSLAADADTNRSHAARAIIRKQMESAQPKKQSK